MVSKLILWDGRKLLGALEAFFIPRTIKESNKQRESALGTSAMVRQGCATLTLLGTNSCLGEVGHAIR